MAAEPAEVSVPATRGSSWAAASLLLGVGVCCPVMSIAAILAGARALVEMKTNPAITGRKMAIAGMSLGAAALVFWALAAMLWHFYARTPMLHGPERELRAGFAGDVANFKHGFAEAGRQASDEEASRFLTAALKRYGAFRWSQQDPGSTAPSKLDGPTLYRISYQLEFEQQQVRAEGAFRTFGESRSAAPSLVFAWEWIRILDPTGDDLIYPESARGAAETGPPATATNP